MRRSVLPLLALSLAGCAGHSWPSNSAVRARALATESVDGPDAFIIPPDSGDVPGMPRDLPSNRTPTLPESLRDHDGNGSVVLGFVIDTLGRPDVGTLTVLASTNHTFASAACENVRQQRFTPAVVDGRRRRALVTKRVTFVVGAAPQPPDLRAVEDSLQTMTPAQVVQALRSKPACYGT